MRIGGVIVAGGRSTRMGREKAFLSVSGTPLIGWIIERLAPQVEPLAINANGDSARYAAFGLPVIPDAKKTGTPLAGLHAALRWAEMQGCDAVLTVPSDAPFLPHDLVSRLAGEGAAVAASGGQAHYLTGLWPVGLLSTLEATLPHARHSRESGNPAFSGAAKESWAPAFAGVTESGAGVTDQGRVMPEKRTIRMQDWVASCKARIVEWPFRPYDPFFNVNTPQELAEAERIAAEFAP